MGVRVDARSGPAASPDVTRKQMPSLHGVSYERYVGVPSVERAISEDLSDLEKRRLKTIRENEEHLASLSQG